MTGDEWERMAKTVVTPSDGIETIDQIRDAMIQKRDAAVCAFEVEEMVLFTHVIYWMSQLQKLEKAVKGKV